MPESWRTKLTRWRFNLFPAYRGTGGRVTYISHDWSEIRLTIPLDWRTRNYVGTIYGGSLYGAVDPIYMLMLMKCLGPGYVVWDKAASIRFQKPGRGRLYATCILAPEFTAAIREELRQIPKLDRQFTIEIVDRAGTVHAVVEKTIHVSRRDASPPTAPPPSV